jgi:Flp pilus assembly protein TadD
MDGAGTVLDEPTPAVLRVRGLLAAEAGDFAGAVAALRESLRGDPYDPEVWADLGACLIRQERPKDAEVALRAALRRAPGHARALGTLGIALTGRDDAAAEAALRAALRIAPDAAGTHGNLGNLLRGQGRYAEAEPHLRAAVTLQPGSADARHNLAVLLAGAGRLVEAEACCSAGLALAPDHADLRFLLGTVHLLAGRLREGWEGFAWRWRRRGFAPPRAFAAPEWGGGAWGGGDRGGGALLLHAEEGLGDTIQMLRFVPEIAARGAVVLQVPAALRRLAATAAGEATVVAEGEDLPPLACRAALPDLPRLLGVELADLPGRVPHLAANPDAVALWRERLAVLPGRRVGLAWAGNPLFAADARRSIPAPALAALADISGVSFVSLQKDGASAPPLALADWTADLTDFADTAALVEALDLVIAVDTSVAHLAGALGRPVWLLNRFDTCWRWMLGRDDSPWYPTLRQFRQTRPGDWGGVLEAVRAALSG